ncbi:MAG TPA: flavin reductase family protein [Oligoflexia bacterium]|nr:flavin reductase family protein [Oligoflexia bacterium]HMR25655.1 flavin reductase family protein [Oligoflexia bacterium]
MLSIDPKQFEATYIYKILTSSVAPRPIALVSSYNKAEQNNLAPFSFFNVFGFNPPIIGFSPTCRGRDGSFKDTYNNLVQSKECVVNIVNHSMQYQMNLASGEYDTNIDEFNKSGFTPVDSQCVKAKRVQESPVQMECKLKQVIDLGGQKGSGNLILCEVVRFHLNKDYLDENNVPDPIKINHIGRNGGEYYTHVNSDSLYTLKVKKGCLGIGFDALPAFIRNSTILTGNELGQLASVQERPQNKLDLKIDNLTLDNCHETIANAIANNDIDLAWRIINELDQ